MWTHRQAIFGAYSQHVRGLIQWIQFVQKLISRSSIPCVFKSWSWDILSLGHVWKRPVFHQNFKMFFLLILYFTRAKDAKAAFWNPVFCDPTVGWALNGHQNIQKIGPKPVDVGTPSFFCWTKPNKPTLSGSWNNHYTPRVVLSVGFNAISFQEDSWPWNELGTFRNLVDSSESRWFLSADRDW